MVKYRCLLSTLTFIPTCDEDLYSISCTAITGRQYDKPPSDDIQFPHPFDLINYTMSVNISKIRIPLIPVRERFEVLKEGGKTHSYSGTFNGKSS